MPILPNVASLQAETKPIAVAHNETAQVPAAGWPPPAQELCSQHCNAWASSTSSFTAAAGLGFSGKSLHCLLHNIGQIYRHHLPLFCSLSQLSEVWSSKHCTPMLTTFAPKFVI